MYLVEMRDEALPSYFAPKVGQQFGAGGGGWSTDKNQALAFARAEDAQVFIDVYLKGVAASCRPVLHKED